MPTPAGPHLLFWHFFQRIEAELSYERWIDKYKIFQDYLSTQPPRTADAWEEFRQLCRILYLQEEHDRLKFDEILEEAIQKEQNLWRSWYQLTVKEETPESQASTPAPNPVNTAKMEPPLDFEPEQGTKKEEKEEKQEQDSPSPVKQILYFHPELEKVFDRDKYGKTNDKVNLDRSYFLHVDEYLPYTRRQMIKGWQRLQRKEVAGNTEQMDLPATIRQIAQFGFLAEPVFVSNYQNRANTLLMYVDVRGSMTPFAELSQRFVQTALNEGGHQQAGVYYFQNLPLQKVYRKDNLSDAVSIKESLLKANPQYTVAVIISDAGSARFGKSQAEAQERFEATRSFLYLLQERTHKIFWINPMPVHRWAGSCAALIAKAGNLVNTMTSIYETDAVDLQELVKKLIRS